MIDLPTKNDKVEEKFRKDLKDKFIYTYKQVKRATFPDWVLIPPRPKKPKTPTATTSTTTTTTVPAINTSTTTTTNNNNNNETVPLSPSLALALEQNSDDDEESQSELSNSSGNVLCFYALCNSYNLFSLFLTKIHQVLKTPPMTRMIPLLNF